MKQINDVIYEADENNFIVRNSDASLMGKSITLGEGDFIENYYERPYTEEEYEKLYGGIYLQ